MLSTFSSKMYAGVLLAAACGQAVYAAPVYWFNNPNNSIDAQDVTFSRGLSDKGAFGDPELSGVQPNSLLFFPSDFLAESENGTADTFTDRLAFKVTADPGKTIQKVRIRETGDWLIDGQGSVQAFGYLEVTKLAGTPGNYKGKDILDVVYTDDQNNITYNSNVAPFNPVLDGNGSWTGIFEITLPAGVTSAQVVLNNILTARTEGGSTATIQKKFLGDPEEGPQFEVGVVVPEPMSMSWLFVGAIGLRRRRA
ncbi:MAG TPA: hypothetical protein VF624_17415 [Tepidisphaeraceae bacterium]